MRLYKQELKRFLGATRTRVIFVIAIVMSSFLALLSSGFNDANVPSKEGNIVSLHGNEAIKFLVEASSDGNCEVSVERLKDALKTYQNLYSEYGMDPLSPGMTEEKFPLDVYWEQVYPIRPLLRMITTAYGTNEKQADLMSLELSDMDRFYKACELRLVDAMESDDMLNDPAYISMAQSIYNSVEKPFVVSHGYTRDAFDYIAITIFLLVLLATIMVAPVFSARYESGEDSVIRCTEFGRGKFVRTTVVASVTVSSMMYLVGIGIHLLVSDMIFGVDTLKESVQVLYAVYSLPSFNLLDLQIILVLTGWICCIAVTVMATCISAFMREASSAMVLSIVMVILPIFIYRGTGTVNWLLALFPSASVGLGNNMLYNLIDLRFLRIGGIIFWYPMVLVIIEIIETLLFGIIAHFAYIRHQVR